VTFVSGNNGSGKSAVLQALQICLGATARSTGRSTSLSNFIRTGATEARVQVTLWNTGGWAGWLGRAAQARAGVATPLCPSSAAWG
jgi:chromosome segregation ATPase